MTIDDLLKQRDALLQQLSSAMRIATPQLGEVEQRSAADIAAALALLDQQIAAASGNSGVMVSVIPASRGLG